MPEAEDSCAGPRHPIPAKFRSHFSILISANNFTQEAAQMQRDHEMHH